MEPSFGVEEINAVVEYMNSGGWLTEYKKTEQLEKMIANYVGSKYCVMVFNGTVSLFCALQAYGIGEGDEVICPDYTMIATANAIKLCGAKPVFCDIERSTLCSGVDNIYEKITKKTKAIMLVSINGRYPNSLEYILSLSYPDTIVIEDAAQSLGSFYNKKHVGTYGNIGSFSFSMPKIITTGQGGCLVTDDKEIYEKLKMIKDFGRPKSGVDVHTTMGWNFKFTDLQAVIGIEQMKKLPERVKKKKQIYKQYKEELTGVKGIEFIKTSNEVAPWFIDILTENRDKLMVKLKENGIITRPFYPQITQCQPYKYVKDKFLVSGYVSSYGLWLPSSVKLNSDDIHYICDTIKRFV